MRVNAPDMVDRSSTQANPRTDRTSRRLRLSKTCVFQPLTYPFLADPHHGADLANRQHCGTCYTRLVHCITNHVCARVQSKASCTSTASILFVASRPCHRLRSRFSLIVFLFLNAGNFLVSEGWIGYTTRAMRRFSICKGDHVCRPKSPCCTTSGVLLSLPCALALSIVTI